MQWLGKLWRWLQSLWTPKPNKVINVEVEENMATVTVGWELNGRAGGQTLLPENARTRVEMSADGGANYVPLIEIPGDAAQQAPVTDLEPGAYLFRMTVLDQLDQASPAHVEPANVMPNPPNAVTNVTVVIE